MLTLDNVKEKFDDLIADPNLLTEGRRNNDTIDLLIMSLVMERDWNYPLAFIYDHDKADAYVEFATENYDRRIEWAGKTVKQGKEYALGKVCHQY